MENLSNQQIEQYNKLLEQMVKTITGWSSPIPELKKIFSSIGSMLRHYQINLLDKSQEKLLRKIITTVTKWDKPISELKKIFFSTESILIHYKIILPKPTMKTIAEKAAEIRKAQSEISEQESNQVKAQKDKALALLISEFEIGFADELPLLKSSGISYSAHYNSAYEHEGSYIKFTLKDKTLKMDFSHRAAYRYEHTTPANPYGGMVYANWEKDRFILFIDEQLIQKAK